MTIRQPRLTPAELVAAMQAPPVAYGDRPLPEWVTAPLIVDRPDQPQPIKLPVDNS